ncbi:MAG: hypothetical protein ACRC0V_13050 [Fusobacteriaceae bacterium]
MNPKIFQVIKEIEQYFFEFKVLNGTQPNIPLYVFRASAMIFFDCLMDKMFDLQEADKMELNDRCKMATAVGEEIRKIVMIYTGIDTFDLIVDDLYDYKSVQSDIEYAFEFE